MFVWLYSWSSSLTWALLLSISSSASCSSSLLRCLLTLALCLARFSCSRGRSCSFWTRLLSSWNSGQSFRSSLNTDVCTHRREKKESWSQNPDVCLQTPHGTQTHPTWASLKMYGPSSLRFSKIRSACSGGMWICRAGGTEDLMKQLMMVETFFWMVMSSLWEWHRSCIQREREMILDKRQHFWQHLKCNKNFKKELLLPILCMIFCKRTPIWQCSVTGMTSVSLVINY